MAAYLKGLGTFRLVAEKADLSVRCAWQREQMVLQTGLASEDLESFFLNDYQPSTIMAPWNGGSGFFPKDNDKALKALESSSSKRFSDYKSCIVQARQELDRLRLKEKPEKENKHLLLQQLRNVLPENALEWLDAAFLLAQDGAKFPPLLGTGGNDGRLEFTNNFMQRLGEVISLSDGTATPQSADWLRTSLFDDARPGLEKAPIGQFDPNGAGGANAGTGFDAASLVNPWDYILMIEGALLFAVASAKRLESFAQGQLAYPFCVRQTGVGYASESLADEKNSRAEMWMPLWNRPASLAELRSVLNEGRAQISGRPARNGIDFARAITSLGVDRGFSEFQRFGFQVRNGLAYFATPLDRLPVRRNRHVRLLEEIDPWLARFRFRAASDNPEPPAGVASALRRLETSILRLCQAEEPARVQDVLCALGSCERVLNRSLRWTRETADLQPLQNLSANWLEAADTGSREFRLAAALASSTLVVGKRHLPFRHFLEPVELRGSREKHRYGWREQNLRDSAWIEGDLLSALSGIMRRQLVITEQAGVDHYTVQSWKPAPLSDISALLQGAINPSQIGDILWGLTLIDWHGLNVTPKLIRDESDLTPDALYAILKLCFAGTTVHDFGIPIIPAILNRTSHGDAEEASRLAIRRLRSSGFTPAIDSVSTSQEHSYRTAAALIFPISSTAVASLAGQVLRTASQNAGTDTAEATLQLTNNQ